MLAEIRNSFSKLQYYVSLEISTKTSLLFILIFTFIAIFDSIVVEVSTYGDAELSPTENVYVFTFLYLGFATTGVVLLNSINKDLRESGSKSKSMQLVARPIVAIQMFNMGIILLAILQMTFLNKYNILLLSFASYVSHVSSLFFLGVLVFKFITWAKSNRNYITILYTISILLLSFSVVVSLIYLQLHFTSSLVPYKKAYPLHLFVTTITTVTKLTESLTIVFDISSVLSFITIWLTTVILLKQYQYRIGKFRYMTLVCIPLLYYLFPFESYFGNLFSPFILNSPVSFGVIYVLIFSATKQVGALLFSLAFISASGLVANPKARKFILVSAIGIAFIFGSIEIVTLQYMLYPPYGIITQSFLPLGSYLLLIGIYYSAVTISRDAVLRKAFYKSAETQLALLKTIGVTQMEKELENRFTVVEKRTRKLEPEEIHTQEEDVRKILRDVLNELYSKSKDD